MDCCALSSPTSIFGNQNENDLLKFVDNIQNVGVITYLLFLSLFVCLLSNKGNSERNGQHSFATFSQLDQGNTMYLIQV